MKDQILNKIKNMFKYEGRIKFWNSVQFDSRLLKKGDWFFALSGDVTDGHLFISQAVQNGASVIVVSEIWWNKKKDKPKANYLIVSHPLTAMQQIAAMYRNYFTNKVVAITGSVGKTTTRNWVVNVLSEKFKISSSIKNYNNHIGLPYSVLNSSLMDDFWVLELGSNHPGEIAFLAEILKPNWSIVTTIGTAHLEFFKSQEEVYKEKTALFNYTKNDGKIFINLDDSYLKNYEAGNIISISLNKPSNYSLEVLDKDILGYYNVKTNKGRIVKLSQPGKHMVTNALFAYAVGREAGLSDKMVANGLEKSLSSDKRMQIVQKEPFIIINDAYNANKESVLAAGKYIMEVEAKRRIIVFGDIFELGEFSEKIHKELIKFLDELGLDMIITTGNETEKVSQFISRTKTIHCSTHLQIQQFLNKFLHPHDLLLLKASRGMALEKILELGLNHNKGTKKC